MKILRLFPVVIIVLLLNGCNGCNRSENREKDVSAIKVDLQVMRFDQDFFAFNNTDFAQHEAFMRSKYGSFYNFYVGQFVIGPRPVGDTTNIGQQAVLKFVSDEYIRRIQDSINYHFNDIKDVEQELTKSLKYFKYYFPEAKVPKVVTINSTFSLGAFTDDKDVLGIGLDLYFGPRNPDYDSAGIFQYVQHKMRREYIDRNAMEVLYNFYFGEQELSHGTTLIEAMVEKGKKMYFLDYVLPSAPDSMIVGFTQKQTKWCEANEYEIWKFLNEKDLLYKDNYMDQKRYLDEGPSTPGMPPEAPGNIGSWIGLQVVRQFMAKTGNKVPMRDLVLKYDAKTILEKAKYRPGKSVF
ncbi:MAG: hypothetical protein JWO06_690 [Bacteroidota bacterium]|nr:hypothetical protein [Bacteroidota bacterium]